MPMNNRTSNDVINSLQKNSDMQARKTAEEMQRKFREDATNVIALKTNMKVLEEHMDSIPLAQIPETDALYHKAVVALDDIRERTYSSAVGLVSLAPAAEESKRIAAKLGYESVEAFLENNQNAVYSEELQIIMAANPTSLDNMFDHQQQLPETNSITR